LKNDSVMTVYHAPLEYDSPAGATWIAYRVTADDGKTWGPERKIVRHKECQASQPTVLRTKQGSLHVFYLGYKKHSWTNGEPNPDDVSDLWAIASRDDGKTWGNRQRIFQGYTGATNGAIQTRSGQIVVPFSHYVGKPGRLVSVTAVSADQGKSWKLSNRIDIGGKGDHSGAVEPAVVELKDGRLWLLIRTERGQFWESFSSDHGLTWGKARPTKIDASHAPGHITRLADGRLALVWNRKKAGRGELSLAFSRDEGKSWSNPLVFARGKQVTYPFVWEHKPGVIWIGFLDVERGWNAVQTRIVRTTTAEIDTLLLSAKLRQRCLTVLREALRSKEFWPSMHAAEALTQAGKGEEVRATLKDRLATETDPQKRCGLARELARAGDRSKTAILFEILKAGGKGETHAAESLYKIGVAGDGKLLRRAMGRKGKEGLRLMAAAALARAGDKPVLAFIRKRLAEGDATDKMLAAYVLARLGDRTDIPQLRRNARLEMDPLKRSFTHNALACLGDADARKTFARNLEAKEGDVRTYAAEAAGQSRAVSLIGALTRLLDDKVVDVRVRAAQALIALSLP
jgi:HEAT repeat protein